VLCCAVLCCAGLCGAVLCCAVLRCAVLFCAMLCCVVLCCAVLCCAVLCCAALCCAVLCCAVLCCAVLCCAVLCCAVLCCAAIISEFVNTRAQPTAHNREKRYSAIHPPGLRQTRLQERQDISGNDANVLRGEGGRGNENTNDGEHGGGCEFLIGLISHRLHSRPIFVTIRLSLSTHQPHSHCGLIN
jgi:hypothetical protein